MRAHHTHARRAHPGTSFAVGQGMRSLRTFGVIVVAAVALTGAGLAAQSLQMQVTVDAARHQLNGLSGYGVFDYLTFTYGQGILTLQGYVYHDDLKAAAIGALRHVQGVDQVISKVEVLPASIDDDDLRWDAFRKIYAEPFFDRYAPTGSAADEVLWSTVEPCGPFAIHIVVKDGHVGLFGVVNDRGDRLLAEVRARDSAAFAIQNDLLVAR